MRNEFVPAAAAETPAPKNRPLRQSRRLLFATILGIVLLGLAGLALLRSTWYLPTNVPSTGSFGAGPISDFFSVGQTLLPPGESISRFDLSIARSGPDDVRVLIEILDYDSGESLRSGRAELKTGRHWYSFEFPVIQQSDPERRLYFRVRADPEQPVFDGDGVVVFYDRADGVRSGFMLERDEPAGAGWDLAIRTYRQVPVRAVAGRIFNMTGNSPGRFVVAAIAGLVGAAWLGGLLVSQFRHDRGPLLAAALIGFVVLLAILMFPDKWLDPSTITIPVSLT
jgi:uncharacterized membrane protein YeaQ/YmgE (transglycosylase-associated protein family)